MVFTTQLKKTGFWKNETCSTKNPQPSVLTVKVLVKVSHSTVYQIRFFNPSAATTFS